MLNHNSISDKKKELRDKLKREFKEKTRKIKNDKSRLEKGLGDFEKLVSIGVHPNSKSPANRKKDEDQNPNSDFLSAQTLK